jgi:hypothetical protein
VAQVVSRGEKDPVGAAAPEPVAPAA